MAKIHCTMIHKRVHVQGTTQPEHHYAFFV